MAYIYVIQNDINDKKYVGKTNFSIEKRFKEHLEDASKREKEHRPLYNAINKYGEKHFSISILEEVSIEEAEKAEQKWIKILNTYYNGYNATLGGDGKSYIDYKKILDLYDNTLKSQVEIANECNCSTDSVKNIIEQYRDNPDWVHRYSSRCIKNNLGIVARQVRCIEENIIFHSCNEAGHWLADNGKVSSYIAAKNHIADCANKKRKTCGKYHWEYI